MARQMISLSAWCLAILPGALLHTVVWPAWVFTSTPYWHVWGMHRLRPSRRPTATRTVSLPSRKPQLAARSASSQSPRCGAVEAKTWLCITECFHDSGIQGRRFPPELGRVHSHSALSPFISLPFLHPLCPSLTSSLTTPAPKIQLG